MPKLKYAVKKLIACWGVPMVLGLPAFAETPVPEREKMEVGNALVCGTPSFLSLPTTREDSALITRHAW